MDAGDWWIVVAVFICGFISGFFCLAILVANERTTRKLERMQTVEDERTRREHEV